MTNPIRVGAIEDADMSARLLSGGQTKNPRVLFSNQEWKIDGQTVSEVDVREFVGLAPPVDVGPEPKSPAVPEGYYIGNSGREGYIVCSFKTSKPVEVAADLALTVRDHGKAHVEWYNALQEAQRNYKCLYCHLGVPDFHSATRAAASRLGVR